MRYLAFARFRLLTTVREATPIFVFATLPPLLAAWYMSTPEPLFRASADLLLGAFARAALLAWLFHAAIIVTASEAIGSMRLLRPDLTSIPSDLMDSAPVGPFPRFWGDALGIFAATLMIHACCLPLLAVVAVLSPLPTIVFVWIEAGMVALTILTSASGAWKRLAPRTNWSATRSARSGILFVILFLLALGAATKVETFRDSLFVFVGEPSMRAWAAVAASVENPFLLVVLLSLLYAGYIVYFVNLARKPAQA